MGFVHGKHFQKQKAELYFQHRRIAKAFNLNLKHRRIAKAQLSDHQQ